MTRPPFRVLQVTDTHLFGDDQATMYGVPTAASLSSVLERALGDGPPPDLILATGDLSQDESPASYRRLAAIFEKTGRPVRCLPGNHDRIETMQSALEGTAALWTDSIDAGGWNVVVLNSVLPGHVSGRLSPDELERLDRTLTARADRPSLVTLHHHPVPVGAPWMDRIMLQNADELFAVLKRAMQPVTVLCGHVHQEVDQMVAGIRVLATPSTSIQFRPRHPVFSLDDQTPGWRWLELYSGGRLETSVGRLPAGSFPADATLKGY